MSNYKEIVAKTIIGKGRKTSKDKYTLIPEHNPDTVLGCWVINNNFKGTNNKNDITINGSFDVNVWYSYDNDSKTAVSTKNFNYDDTMKLRVKDYDALNNQNEIIIRNLKQPTVQDVKIKNNEIILTIEKELGVELVGEGKVKIAAYEDELPWDDVIPDTPNDIKEEYLSDKE